MIYMIGKSGQRIVILEPANLDNLRVGGIVKTPDDANEIILAFSPDIVWTGQQIKAAFDGEGIDVAKLQDILAQSQSRPEIRERPFHHKEMISGKRERGGEQ